MRICIVGDELVAGVGDPRGLGWVGRAVARTVFPTPPVVMPLAVPGETTGGLAARWEPEVTARLVPGGDDRLVVCVGSADVPAGISTPRARLNLANIVDRATNLKFPCMVVGPPPLAGADRQHLHRLSQACAEVCERRRLPFIDTLTPLQAHDQWTEDMTASGARTVDGAVLPGQAGYALIAWLVLHQGWHDWLGTVPRD
ncbi:GDSL-type esterase/lipase family protein [Actinomyces polynesiensis]|uniref:GDSL-type esterase/lipase family protein n=1 Tax=Actinomyces polynesiensis TaxID=1325934 RepID=UPI0005BD5167|nr:GDSL-type esterase/lipase family protein [Actinomyces polynesiensis]